MFKISILNLQSMDTTDIQKNSVQLVLNLICLDGSQFKCKLTNLELPSIDR